MSTGPQWRAPRKLDEPEGLVYAEYWLWMRRNGAPGAAPRKGPVPASENIVRSASTFTKLHQNVLEGPEQLVRTAFRRSERGG